MQRRSISLLALGIANFFLIGACMANLFGKTELTPEWVERFNKVANLNEYAQSHVVQLSDVVLTSYDLTGVNLNGASFENTEWKGTQLNKGSLANTQFKKTKLDGVKFQDSVLSDVTFEDVELREVSFFKATLKHVKFIRCKFDAVTADNLKTSDVEFVDSKLVNSSFSEGQLIAIVKNSNLNDVEFTDLEIPSSLTFEKSELKEVEFSRSVLTSVILKNVSSTKTGMRNGKIHTLDIEGGEVAFGLSESSVEILSVRGARIRSMSMDDAKIPELRMSDILGTNNVGLYRAKIGVLMMERCVLNDFRPRMAMIERWILKDSSLTNSKFEKMKVRDLVFDNVTLSGNLTFKGASAERQQITNIKKLADLQLNTDGSNIKLD